MEPMSTSTLSRSYRSTAWRSRRGTLQKVVRVPANKTLVIRMRFTQFVGKSVYCRHILPHEDTGMMQNFLIVDSKESNDAR